ncbi:MAG: flagellar M-ring protein FliF [Rhizobiales bacterium]|nr:flagellar M-ring protein FliF [Hyphomicrobiales bacterium]OJY44768.1 MAG: flagellar M-ring protein FliF [Rhizobiales bacterium 64-17]
MQAFFDFLKSLGAARMAAMAAVTAMMIGFFGFVIMRVTAPQMVPLFTDLTVEDSSAIIKDLERQAIAYEIKNDGAIIMVPKDRVGRLRMKLAEAGLPKGGGVGYEIFDKSDALGTTSFIQNINHLRALEGELARTIRSIDRVQAARVHLVMPERPLFSRDKAEPSASIVITSRGKLETSQVRAIRHLIASAVNGLKPERISIVDEAGRLLADGSMQDGGMGAAADERKINYERRLREQVDQIVTSVVGPGRARVQLNAEFDFNRITQTSDRFDPEGRVVRSSQTREEQSQSADKEGQVSVGNELPNGQKADAASSRGDQAKKTEEIVNYEISRTTKTEVTEAGRINRISAAVLVDGTYTKNDKGEIVYQPRSKEEIDRIAALVRSAIGFDQKRGDQVEVVNLRFAEQPAAVGGGESSGVMSLLQFTKDDIMRAIEMSVMMLLGLVVMFMVVRPLMRKAFGTDVKALPAPRQATLPGTVMIAGAAGDAGGTTTTSGGSGGGSISTSGGPNVAIVGSDESVAISNRTSNMIDVAQVQGQVHAQSVQKVGELANKNPQEAISIIRNWLHEDAA